MPHALPASNGLTSAPLAFSLAEPAPAGYAAAAVAPLRLADLLQPPTAFGPYSGWQALDAGAGPGATAFALDLAWNAARVALPGSVE